MRHLFYFIVPCVVMELKKLRERQRMMKQQEKMQKQRQIQMEREMRAQQAIQVDKMMDAFISFLINSQSM